MGVLICVGLLTVAVTVEYFAVMTQFGDGNQQRQDFSLHLGLRRGKAGHPLSGAPVLLNFVAHRTLKCDRVPRKQLRSYGEKGERCFLKLPKPVKSFAS